MIWRLLLLLLLASAQPAPSRNLAPEPEPIGEAAVISRIYLPFVAAVADEVTAATNDRPIYGYATPHRRTYDVPFFMWDAQPRYCGNAHYWPMVRGQTVPAGMVDQCDDGDRMLLIYNEPELGHMSATPKEAVSMVEVWRSEWNGPLACCGNFYGSVPGYPLSGLEWMLTFVEEYHIEHGIVPPIDALHLHVYETGALDAGELAQWRSLADAYGWQIIVSESGTFPTAEYTPEDVADELPIFLAEVEGILRPDVLMWFSDYIRPWALEGDTAWHHLNLTNIDGSLTPVGVAWELYTHTTIADARAGQP